MSHFAELQKDIDRLRKENRLSRHPVFRGYIDPMSFTLPKDFPGARSVIVLAKPTKMMKGSARWAGRTHEIFIPPQYYVDDFPAEAVKAVLRADVLRSPEARLERTTSLHLKLLAVRSGLGRYGRNNLCFVEGLGSFLTLYAFFTDAVFPEDHWRETALLEACRDCPICVNVCPTGAIPKGDFVIDVGRCLTLYNEIEGSFPSFILPSMHHALIGCLTCQLRCPVNETIPEREGTIDALDEEEVRKLLTGEGNDSLLESLARKLRSASVENFKSVLPVYRRNLRLLLR